MIGRILGFGNVHIITSSGIGIQSVSTEMSVGLGADEGVKSGGSLLAIFGWVSKQRQRSVMAKDPAECLFGIRDPMGIYRLINEIMDQEVGEIASDQTRPE